MLKILISLFIIIILLPACIEKKDDTNTSKTSVMEDTQESKKSDPVKIAEIKRPKTENDFLMIINYTPINSSYDFIKQVLPGLSELDMRYRRYYKAYSNTTIFNRETMLEFNFSTDSTMQSVSLHIRQLKYNEADSLYKELQKYYSNKFGKYKEEISKNPGQSVYPIFHGSFWKSVTVGLNENGDNSSLDWGF